MDLKCIFALFTLSVLPWSASAAPAAPKVVVKSEVASPVVLENTQDKNYLKISLVGYPLPQEKRSPIQSGVGHRPLHLNEWRSHRKRQKGGDRRC